MPGFDYGYEGGRGGLGAAGRPAGDMVIAVGVPQVPLFYPAVAKQAIAKLVLDNLRLALMNVAGHVSDNAPVDSGQLAQSFGADPATSTGGIEVLGTDVVAGVSGRVFSSLPYAVVMDQGRRPGAPISKAGIDAIGLWAERKLGLSADEAKDAKWAIANAIVAHGIEGKEFARVGFEAARPGVESIFQDLSQSIGTALVSDPKSGGK
jgi:hypothetical protein